MSKNRVAVMAVVSGRLSVSAAALEYQMSRRHLHRLLARYRAGGLESVDPGSRRPLSNPAAIPDVVKTRIVELRVELVGQGLDAGPVTIGWHLQREGFVSPSTATIRRVLHLAGLVRPQPKKRPRSSYIRFEADLPNQCWQSDFTHVRLADDTDVEVISWLDDHSRYLLHASCYRRVTGPIVVATFTTTTNQYGLPASTLTDNGMVYTTRLARGGITGPNQFETLIASLGITQKNGRPSHPTTQGKIERYHQTLKRWLAARPPATTLTDLQTQLDQFRYYYNEHRPHRACNRNTPGQAYRATPKAAPAGTTNDTSHRIRHDKVDKTGRITLRHQGKLRHLHIGAAHRGQPVIAIIDTTTATIINTNTGEILATCTINPNRNYWPNTQKAPGRWPKASQQ